MNDKHTELEFLSRHRTKHWTLALNCMGISCRRNTEGVGGGEEGKESIIL